MVMTNFAVVAMFLDGEFEPLQADLAQLQVNLKIFSEDEHIHSIQHLNRTIKEQIRGIYNSLPCKCYPSKMIIKIVYLAMFWLNLYPPFCSIVDNMSPRTLITEASVDYNEHYQL
eukprot:2722767-Ditylum_brightwellii.AAC.1